MPRFRPIPLVILLYPPGPLTFFLYGRLGYRSWFIICCINFPTCLVPLDSFLQLRYFVWFLYGTFHPYVPDSFISVSTSHRINSISRFLPAFDFMERFWLRLRLSIYIVSFFVFLISSLLYSETFFSILLLASTQVWNCALDGAVASVFQAHALHWGTLIFSASFCSWRSCRSTPHSPWLGRYCFLPSAAVTRAYWYYCLKI